jgi:aspartate/methionine/tyrosine aminotransferase
MTRSISPAALLRDSGVAAAPGPDFDDLRGNRYMRFSFAGTEADIVEGIERLARWPK